MKKHLLLLIVLLIGVALGSGVTFLVRPAYKGSEDPRLSAVRVTEGTVVARDDTTATFRHPRFGFSLSYPKELSVTELDEGEGARTIVFQKQGEQYGFQLFIVPYEGDTISPERIQKDIPSGIVEDPVEAVIGDGIHATVFWSESPSVGKTREAWFIHQGHLYEATAYAELDALLGETLSTIDFN